MKSEHLSEGLKVTVLTVFETLLFYLKTAAVFYGASADSRAVGVQSLSVRQHIPRFQAAVAVRIQSWNVRDFQQEMNLALK